VSTTVKPKGGRPSQGAREAALAAARDLFIERDFHLVSTSEILGRAGISRGALYHHFPSKHDLYEAVWMDSERRLTERLAARAASATTPLEALLAAMDGYLSEAAENVELRRIGLLQSRTVLGWERWRAGISDIGLAVVSAGLAAAMDAGELARADVEATAHLVLAAMIEAALLIAVADDPDAQRAAAEPTLLAMIDGLRAQA